MMHCTVAGDPLVLAGLDAEGTDFRCMNAGYMAIKPKHCLRAMADPLPSSPVTGSTRVTCCLGLR